MSEQKHTQAEFDNLVLAYGSAQFDRGEYGDNSAEFIGEYPELLSISESAKTALCKYVTAALSRIAELEQQLSTQPSSKAPEEQVEAIDIQTMQDVYALGWRRCAEWAKRDDLPCDIGSPAYLNDLAKDLTPYVSLPPTEWSAREKQALSNVFDLIATREQLTWAEGILRRYTEGWTEYRNGPTIDNHSPINRSK